MVKKEIYVCPLTEIIPVKVENLLGAGVSYVDEDGDDGPGRIEDGGEDPPAPGKGWSFDDDDDSGMGNVWN